MCLRMCAHKHVCVFSIVRIHKKNQLTYMAFSPTAVCWRKNNPKIQNTKRKQERLGREGGWGEVGCHGNTWCPVSFQTRVNVCIEVAW